MAGAVVAVGLVGATAVLAVGLAGVGSAAVAGQRMASAADSAALAAADAASGAVPGGPGGPCDRASEVASTAGARIETCDLDGLIATVTVAMRVGPFDATASARAGPPP